MNYPFKVSNLWAYLHGHVLCCISSAAEDAAFDWARAEVHAFKATKL